MRKLSPRPRFDRGSSGLKTPTQVIVLGWLKPGTKTMGVDLSFALLSSSVGKIVEDGRGAYAPDKP